MSSISSVDFSKHNEVQIEKIGTIERSTSELVIGLVGPVGAGVSTTADKIAQLLKDEYNYDEVTIVKVSDIIRQNAQHIKLDEIASEGTQRIVNLQLAGTKLRDRFGDDYLAGKAIEEIGLSRATGDGYEETAGAPIPKALRRATIIDSLKHQDETRLLRETYGGLYWQFAIFAPETVRGVRLSNIGIDRTELAGIFTRDEDDTDDDHGQKVSNTAHLSDFFIRNDKENHDQLMKVLGRYLEIVYGITIHTPTINESGMQAAVSAARKSACLSKQVGASIYSKTGELLSIGWNDVPQNGGGLYTDELGPNDHRCFKWRDGECHNDMRKELLYKLIHDELKSDGLLTSKATVKTVKAAIKRTPVKRLIEYSRAVHAEMEAIVSAARMGKEGIVGGSLYTTTFPCHNCARHIVAAGISKVFYIEPYAKSLAMELHGDSISLTKEKKKVSFLQYEGVGPTVSMKLFQAHSERKIDGKAKILDKKTAFPVLPPPLDGFTTHEKRVIDRIHKMER